MTKEKNNLWAIILFSVIWLARPISYDEMQTQHPIFFKPDELTLLEKSDKIIESN